MYVVLSKCYLAEHGLEVGLELLSNHVLLGLVEVHEASELTLVLLSHQGVHPVLSPLEGLASLHFLSRL